MHQCVNGLTKKASIMIEMCRTKTMKESIERAVVEVC